MLLNLTLHDTADEGGYTEMSGLISRYKKAPSSFDKQSRGRGEARAGLQGNIFQVQACAVMRNRAVTRQPCFC